MNNITIDSQASTASNNHSLEQAFNQRKRRAQTPPELEKVITKLAKEAFHSDSIIEIKLHNFLETPGNRSIHHKYHLFFALYAELVINKSEKEAIKMMQTTIKTGRNAGFNFFLIACHYDVGIVEKFYEVSPNIDVNVCAKEGRERGKTIFWHMAKNSAWKLVDKMLDNAPSININASPEHDSDIDIGINPLLFTLNGPSSLKLEPLRIQIAQKIIRNFPELNINACRHFGSYANATAPWFLARFALWELLQEVVNKFENINVNAKPVFLLSGSNRHLLWLVSEAYYIKGLFDKLFLNAKQPDLNIREQSGITYLDSLLLDYDPVGRWYFHFSPSQQNLNVSPERKRLFPLVVTVALLKNIPIKLSVNNNFTQNEIIKIKNTVNSLMEKLVSLINHEFFNFLPIEIKNKIILNVLFEQIPESNFLTEIQLHNFISNFHITFFKEKIKKITILAVQHFEKNNRSLDIKEKQKAFILIKKELEGFEPVLFTQKFIQNFIQEIGGKRRAKTPKITPESVKTAINKHII